MRMFDALVETEVLAAHLDDPEWAVCDCRSVLSDPEAGPKRYAESHIPGARYLHLERDLSGPLSPDTGRHPLPDPAKLAVMFGRIGIGDGVQVVAPLLCAHVGTGGHLVLAGILERQTQELIDAYAPWCRLSVADQEEGWVLLTATL